MFLLYCTWYSDLLYVFQRGGADKAIIGDGEWKSNRGGGEKGEEKISDITKKTFSS